MILKEFSTIQARQKKKIINLERRMTTSNTHLTPEGENIEK